MKIVELCLQPGHPEPHILEQAGAHGTRAKSAGLHSVLELFVYTKTTGGRNSSRCVTDGFLEAVSNYAAGPAAKKMNPDDTVRLSRAHGMGIVDANKRLTW